MANYASPIPSTQSTNTFLPAEISPSSLDTLPVLTTILTRLQTSSQSGHSSLTTSGNSPQPTQASLALGNTSVPTVQDFSNPYASTPLVPKDIPAATDALKHRLQKTRVQVSQLPDMDRSCAEQEEEIRELEARIKEQRKVLEGLRDVASGGAD